MYQTLLTWRYLTSKVMPLLSVVAVMLCTAMVVVVWSIMGGFLVMLLASGRTLMGDVAISWPTAGFAHYDELIKRLETDPDVAGAAAAIEAFGVVTLPDNRTIGVSILGIDGPSFSKVADYERTLWWKPISEPLPKDRKRQDPRLHMAADDLKKLHEQGLSLIAKDADGAMQPAAVLGIEIAGFSDRTAEGFYIIPESVGTRQGDGSVGWQSGFLAGKQVTLTVLPMSRRGGIIQHVTRPFPVANEFRSELYELDSKTVLVNLRALQSMLKMDEAQRISPDQSIAYDIQDNGQGESFSDIATLGVDPARVTTVLVRARDGVDPVALKRKILDGDRRRPETMTGHYADFVRTHAGEVPPVDTIDVRTWRDRQATFIAAVEKEIVLVLGIIVFISFVASFLILAIFWAMVAEKTKDIGILRAVGASRAGVAWLWLYYGLIIGLFGSILGCSVATVIVRNINPIHDWLGKVFGISIWNPDVYYFSTIPNQVEPVKVLIVLVGGIFFSVLGALIPAIRAARLRPVQALRFE